MDKREVLKKAEENGNFDDLVCDECNATNQINWQDRQKDDKGVWYSCKKCGHLNLIGWDIIEEMANQ